MLTDMIVEEEFEIKEEEPWYDKQDLEHDLQLAAELGKTLLERNRELEQGLQQMYSTNQEQLQEIEYLTKQVDLLRQVNDQHAKVYEQLDVSARELEQSNHKLVLDNRTAQHKIQGLTETVELLQVQVEELQHQVEELKLSPQPQKPPQRERWSTRSSQSVSCLKELQNTLRCEYDPDETSGALESSDVSWREEEQASLRQSLRNLQTQFASERAQREQAELEAELLTAENAALEQQLAGLEGCQARVFELERETEELRQLWKSSTRASRPDVIHNLLPDSMFLNPEEESEGDAAAAKSPRVLKRWGSERLMKATQMPDSPNRIYDHECSCVRRAEVVKYRGISLLNEVDAQYSALQVKYDELLQRCHLGFQDEAQDVQSHKSVQTPSLTGADPALTNVEDFDDDFHQPEYKELFREIFSRIQKTKEDLIENRVRPSAGDVLPSLH
ncbi:cerebellar degeneration-related protein 2-like [Toxotes jaculatrix]|uniref:cerebellar degeneration-related protein 2-like n=1 Tax=Toxotes jaculatrix TaxID=941984 RepID=UPI001B3A82EC|nr:cerebellar degeneration-related protein 2-like [Toxotes jaculatrix]XP_040923322.1 cerebellar degeneration-related protein 2-like [Toxotes jaculatrix]